MGHAHVVKRRLGPNNHRQTPGPTATQNPAMSDTPLTDAHQRAMEREDFDVELALTYEFARQRESENSAMREAIKEAHALFQDFSNAQGHTDKVALLIQTDWVVAKSREALAKLQPFIQ